MDFFPISHTQNWVTIEILTKTTKNSSERETDRKKKRTTIFTNTTNLNHFEWHKLWQMYKERKRD